MIYRLTMLTLLCMLAFPAAAVDVPPEFEPFILDAKDNRKSWLQMLCETYDICEKSRANRSLAMVIGVSKYKDLKDLETTGNDAQELATFLLESDEFDQVVLLLEADATKERINWFMEDYFPEILKEERNSRFLFYFSGHGEYTEATSRGYLRLADNQKDQNYRSIGMDTVATWAKRNTNNAIHSLFLIDACVSGITGLETMGDDEKSDFPARDPSELIEERAGWLLTAGKGRQKAWAAKKWDGSLFNYALMQGLQRGKADRQGSDGIITSLELYDYIDAVVRHQSPAGQKQTPQRWRFRPGSGDFFFKSPKTRVSVARTKPKIDAENMGTDSRQIKALLRECQAHFDANRLTTGRGGNAADCYEEVLKLDRGNPRALEGLTAIENRYRNWAEKALNQGRLERAKRNIAKIELFNPEGDAVFELKEQLRKAERGDKPLPKPITITATAGRTQSQRLAGEMISIEGGCFQMGSPENEEGRFDDETQHRVCVGAFKIGKTEVSQQQWREVMGSNNPSGFKDCDDCPVETVSWNDVQDFLQKLNTKTGKRFRLPTEAEWEYAARAGTTGPFSFQGKISAVKVNYDASYTYAGSSKGQYRGKTVPVGSLPANPWGLHEVHGNVWEWTCSAYDENYGGSEEQCAGGNDSGRRVLRGGSWDGRPGARPLGGPLRERTG